MLCAWRPTSVSAQDFKRQIPGLLPYGFRSCGPASWNRSPCCAHVSSLIALADRVLSHSHQVAYSSYYYSLDFLPTKLVTYSKTTMPEPVSKIINHSSQSEMRIGSRWDALPDQHPSAADRARCTSEVSNYKGQQWKYRSRPFHLSISPLNSQPILPPEFHPEIEECYDFCWKSCAIYCLVDSDILSMRPTMLDFFHAIYRCWFKGDETNVSWDNFFGKIIACWQQPEATEEPTTKSVAKRLLATNADIPTLIANHRPLCTHIKARLAEPPPENKRLYHEGCQFRPVFEKVFVVMDTVNWDWEGLSIIRSDQAHPLRLDCNNFDRPQPAFRKGDQGQEFRPRLEDMVRLVESMRARDSEQPM